MAMCSHSRSTRSSLSRSLAVLSPLAVLPQSKPFCLARIAVDILHLFLGRLLTGRDSAPMDMVGPASCLLLEIATRDGLRARAAED